MKCVKGYKIEPMQSAAGWYMGTRSEEGWPNCRMTNKYYKTPAEAIDNMYNDYRFCEENNFCSGGRVCYDWIKVMDDAETE